VSTLDGDVTDITDAAFRIEANFVKVSTPNTAGTWDVGTIRRIKWQHVSIRLDNAAGPGALSLAV
jgi:hypothetical protein